MKFRSRLLLKYTWLSVSRTGEFLRAFAFNAGITLHAKVLYGGNTHHKIEALFKALGHALAAAVRKDGSTGVLSTKGVL